MSIAAYGEAEPRDVFTRRLLETFSRKSTRKEYLDAVVEILQQCSGCRCVGIRVVDEQGNAPYESHVGFDPAFWRQENWLSVKRDTCACSRVIQGTPEPQEAAAITPGGSFRADDSIAFLATLPPEAQRRYRGNCMQWGFASLAIIPIRYQGQTLGAIHLADERPGAATAACVDFIESMTPLIGEATHRFNVEAELRSASAHMRSLIEAQRLLAGKLLTAQEDERRRLAREMHDDLTQRLAVLAIDAGKLEHECDQAGPQAPRLRQIKEQLIQLSEDMHALSRQLHPAILDDLGLVDALRSECARFSEREGIAVCFSPGEMPAEIPKDVALCLYRIAQEGLRNIAKHSGAGQARIALDATEDGILLSIEDRGTGFDPTAASDKPGLGLASMEERARLVEGEFSIRSLPGQGTLIEVWAPLPGRMP